MSTPRVRPLADLLQLFTGPAVWFAHFTVVYGAEALICTPPVGSPRAMVWIGAAATIAALGALGAFAVALLRRQRNPKSAGRAHRCGIFARCAALLLALLSAMRRDLDLLFRSRCFRACTSPAG